MHTSVVKQTDTHDRGELATFRTSAAPPIGDKLHTAQGAHLASVGKTLLERLWGSYQQAINKAAGLPRELNSEGRDTGRRRKHLYGQRQAGAPRVTLGGTLPCGFLPVTQNLRLNPRESRTNISNQVTYSQGTWPTHIEAC